MAALPSQALGRERSSRSNSPVVAGGRASWEHFAAFEDKESIASGSSDVLHVAKNTFIEYREDHRVQSTMRRSLSESDLHSQGSGTPRTTSGSSQGALFALGVQQGSSAERSDQSSLFGALDQPMPSSDVRPTQRIGSGPPGQTSESLHNDAELAELNSLFEELVVSGSVPLKKVEKLRELLPLVPRDPVTGSFTSTGSLSHFEGECRHCVFWFKGSCTKGVACNYCHFSHQGQRTKRIRLSKRTRANQRGRGDEDSRDCPSPVVAAAFVTDADAVADVSPPRMTLSTRVTL